MGIVAACPHCQQSLRFGDDAHGQSFRCPTCGRPFTLPAAPSVGTSSPVSTQGSHFLLEANPRLPGQFGRYHVIRLLGKGGMGAVYLAHDAQLDRRVALKIPRQEDGENSDSLKRFAREARAAAILNHPNICPIYDVGVMDGVHYMAMAYIEGPTLAQVIRKQKRSGVPFTQREAAEMVRKLALALAEAHAQGIIHRDVKPANIIINPEGEPVLMDFGLARLQHEDVRLTRTGAIMGTPAYMSPEQARGDVHVVGAGCDIYSLGVILFEMLTGELPYKGPVHAVIAQILQDRPPPVVYDYRPDVDPRLARICKRAMSREMVERHPGAQSLAEELTRFLDSEQESSPASAVPSSRSGRSRDQGRGGGRGSGAGAPGQGVRPQTPSGRPGLQRPPKAAELPSHSLPDYLRELDPEPPPLFGPGDASSGRRTPHPDPGRPSGGKRLAPVHHPRGPERGGAPGSFPDLPPEPPRDYSTLARGLLYVQFSLAMLFLATLFVCVFFLPKELVRLLPKGGKLELGVRWVQALGKGPAPPGKRTSLLEPFQKSSARSIGNLGWEPGLSLLCWWGMLMAWFAMMGNGVCVMGSRHVSGGVQVWAVITFLFSTVIAGLMTTGGVAAIVLEYSDRSAAHELLVLMAVCCLGTSGAFLFASLLFLCFLISVCRALAIPNMIISLVLLMLAIVCYVVVWGVLLFLSLQSSLLPSGDLHGVMWIWGVVLLMLVGGYLLLVGQVRGGVRRAGTENL